MADNEDASTRFYLSHQANRRAWRRRAARRNAIVAATLFPDKTIYLAEPADTDD